MVRQIAEEEIRKEKELQTISRYIMQLVIEAQVASVAQETLRHVKGQVDHLNTSRRLA